MMTLRMGDGIASGSQHYPDWYSSVLLRRLVEALLLAEWFVACHP